MQTIQEKVTEFFKQYPTSTYPKDTVLLAAEDTSSFFYFIETGAVKMCRTTAEGRNLVLHIFFPQSYFSLLSLVNRGKNQYDFITLGNTTVRKITQTDVVSFLQENVDVLYDLQLRLLKGMSGMLKRIEQSSLSSARDQILSLLVYYTSHFSETKVEKTQLLKFKIKITHQEIADWLGLSRENVSLQMKTLENEGLTKTEDHFITIPDLTKLKVSSQQDLI